VRLHFPPLPPVRLCNTFHMCAKILYVLSNIAFFFLHRCLSNTNHNTFAS
jgi:hypothetical protein